MRERDGLRKQEERRERERMGDKERIKKNDGRKHRICKRIRG